MANKMRTCLRGQSNAPGFSAKGRTATIFKGCTKHSLVLQVVRAGETTKCATVCDDVF